MLKIKRLKYLDFIIGLLALGFLAHFTYDTLNKGRVIDHYLIYILIVYTFIVYRINSQEIKTVIKDHFSSKEIHNQHNPANIREEIIFIPRNADIKIILFVTTVPTLIE